MLFKKFYRIEKSWAAKRSHIHTQNHRKLVDKGNIIQKLGILIDTKKLLGEWEQKDSRHADTGMTMEAGNLFAFFMTRTEHPPLLRRKRLGACSIMKVFPLSPCFGGCGKKPGGLPSISILKFLQSRVRAARGRLLSSEMH